MCSPLLLKDLQDSDCQLKFASIVPVWIILNCLPMWITIYRTRKHRPDPVRDEPFRPFTRVDYDKWSYIMTIFTHFFFIPRNLLCWASAIGCMLICAVITIGHPRSKKLGPIRQQMCALVVALTARFMLMMYGVPWIKKQKVLSDYSKWLGPDWKVDPA